MPPGLAGLRFSTPVPFTGLNSLTKSTSYVTPFCTKKQGVCGISYNTLVLVVNAGLPSPPVAVMLILVGKLFESLDTDDGVTDRLPANPSTNIPPLNTCLL